MNLRSIALFACVVWMPCVAQADIYKCVDASGRITYTNAKTAAKGCAVLTRDLAPSQPARRSEPAGSGTTTAEGGSFPRVDASTQQARDGNRRSILERELASEEKLLAEARQEALRNYANSPGAQVPSEKVQLHERNIAALRKEISKLK